MKGYFKNQDVFFSSVVSVLLHGVLLGVSSLLFFRAPEGGMRGTDVLQITLSGDTDAPVKNAHSQKRPVQSTPRIVVPKPQPKQNLPVVSEAVSRTQKTVPDQPSSNQPLQTETAPALATQTSASPVDNPIAPSEQTGIQQSVSIDQTPGAGSFEGHPSSAAASSAGEGSFSQPGGQQTAPPMYLQNPVPQYPPLARRRGQQGTVMVRVRVSQEGKPLEVSLQKSSGFALLDAAALEAVQRWTFKPATAGFLPVASTVEVPIRFRLQE